MKYSIEHGNYVLRDKNSMLLSSLNHVSVVLTVPKDNPNDILMMKHGDPKLVNKWFNRAKDKYLSSGFKQYADELMIFTGQFPVVELNKLISCTGYAVKFLEKLENNTMEREENVIPFDPELELPALN